MQQWLHHADHVKLDYFFQVLSPGKDVNDIDDVFFQDRFGWRHCCAIFSALQPRQNLGRYKQSSLLWTRISKSEPLPTHLSRMQHKSSTHTFPLSSHCRVGALTILRVWRLKPIWWIPQTACNLEVAGRLSPRRGGTRAARRRLAWRYPMWGPSQTQQHKNNKWS